MSLASTTARGRHHRATAPADRQPLRHRAPRRALRRAARHLGADAGRARAAPCRQAPAVRSSKSSASPRRRGQRYAATFLASSALTGAFDPTWLEQTDAHGVSMRDAMRSAGLPGKVAGHHRVAPRPQPLPGLCRSAHRARPRAGQPGSAAGHRHHQSTAAAATPVRSSAWPATPAPRP